jgi:hypothetical protein
MLAQHPKDLQETHTIEAFIPQVDLHGLGCPASCWPGSGCDVYNHIALDEGAPGGQALHCTPLLVCSAAGHTAEGS